MLEEVQPPSAPPDCQPRVQRPSKQFDFMAAASLAVPDDGLIKALRASPASVSPPSYPGCSSASSTSRGLGFKSVMLGLGGWRRAGLADAICDLVSTGATLEANGLKEVEVIYRPKGGAGCRLPTPGTTLGRGSRQAAAPASRGCSRPTRKYIAAARPGKTMRTPSPPCCPAQRRHHHAARRRDQSGGAARRLQRNPVLGRPWSSSGPGASSILVLPSKDDGIRKQHHADPDPGRVCSARQPRCR